MFSERSTIIDKFEKMKNKYLLIGSALIIVLIVVFLLFFNFYKKIYAANVNVKEGESIDLYIETGSTLDDVVRQIDEDSILLNAKSFKWVAERKNYQNHVYPGRYQLSSNMNNDEIVDLLRSGQQKPVKVVFNNIRTLEKLAGIIGKQIEPDSSDLIRAMKDTAIMDSLGFTYQSYHSMFIPNTYEFWWNTSPKGFLSRMHNEYNRFWNEERLAKAEKLNLTKVDVTTLASIVDEETYKDDEMPLIAGVYINRLRKRMHLQADPTIKFAIGDFTVKRILTKHLQVESPYNTYKNYGLPPGPIAIPSIAAIDAVLNYTEHDYLYFCAKPDFSGYHNFAKSLRQHNINANQYRKALNKERIWR